MQRLLEPLPWFLSTAELRRTVAGADGSRFPNEIDLSKSNRWNTMRYFLIDRVTELVVGERVRGIKNVTLTDDILNDHFPDYPIMPGALIIEASAQLAGFLLEMTFNREEGPIVRALLAQVNRAKFHETSGPGDTLDISVTIDSLLESAARVSAEVRVGDRKIMTGMLMFVMKQIDSDRLHEQRRYLYRLWTRDLKTRIPLR